MSAIRQQDCPLCSAPAEYQFIDYEERKHFRCKNCIEFVISRRAEKRLAESISQWRSQYSELAKKSDRERILHIFIPSVQKEEGVGYPALEGKMVPRSSLAL